MRRIAALVLGASLLALPACGSKTDETSRAAGITPANALAMLTVNLRPSIEQKRNMLSIARQFPDARDKVKGEFEDARDNVLEGILDDSGLDYAKDVKPWLGKEAAVAVLPPGAASTPLIVAMVQTEDPAKAQAAIAKATKAGDFEGVYGIIDNFVVISDQDDPADNKTALDLITAQAKKGDGGLSKSAGFTKVVDQLHGDRLVLGWADVKAALAAADSEGDLDPGGIFKDFVKGSESVAFDLHAESKAVVFQGVASAGGTDKGSAVELTRSLPTATLAALTLFNLDTIFTTVLDAIGGSGGSDPVAQLEEATGIDVQTDLLSWMGGEATVAVGPLREGQPIPDFALVVEPTDKAKAEAGIAKLVAKLTEQGLPIEETTIDGTKAYAVSDPESTGIPPAAMALFADRFVLASSSAYLGDLAEPATSSLGDSDSYTAVLGKEDKGTTGQLIVLLDPIREALEKALLNDPGDRASYEKDFKLKVEPLAAFGVRAHRDGDFNRFEMRLTFD